LSKLTGARKGNWKGGMSMFASGFRGTNWPAVAEKIRERDKFECVFCGMSNDAHISAYGKSLEVHHKVPFHNFTRHALANAPSNLVTLCIPCHRAAEAKIPAIQMSLSWAESGNGRNILGLARGTRHGQAVLTDELVMSMRIKRAEGISVYRLSKDNGVSYGAAKSAITGVTWTHVPMPIHQVLR
jgi:hypothetical protein